jgi:hypothetical protein
MERTMTVPSFVAVSTAAGPGTGSGYQPGICNIGPAEIARRRRAGHVGLLATLALFVVLVVSGVPPVARLLVAVPAAGAASGYLQARLRFCAGFGSRGVFNFGPLGQADRVASDEDRARDRTRATQIGLASLAIGVAAGIAAVTVPR